MKQVTYTSTSGDVKFFWSEKTAIITYQGDVIQRWGENGRDKPPKLEQFEAVAENFIRDYDAVIDRMFVKYPKNFFDNEYRNLPSTEEPSEWLSLKQ